MRTFRVSVACLAALSCLATAADAASGRNATKSTDPGDASLQLDGNVTSISAGFGDSGGGSYAPTDNFGGAMTAPAIDIDDHIANDSAAGAGHIAPD
ncbi:MAG: hypothetical protein KA104_01490 [Candidatus Pacebacteria bacterium]|nr:hypothetical protein [Candidatus Paceibacterota bacterium]